MWTETECCEKTLERPSSGVGRPDANVEGQGAALKAYLDQDVEVFFYRWGRLLSEALVGVRARFDGDIDQYLLMVVFQLNQLSRSASNQASGKAAPVMGMNALSLADITHIPRETTRRKLQALEAQGYIVRGPDSLYYLGDRYGLDSFFYDLKPLFWDAMLLSHPQTPGAGVGA